jgi:putative ABC transport system permease protein
VLAEGVCIGILSYLIAIPLSVPMSAVVGNGFGRIMFQAPIVYVTAPSGLLAWFVIVVLLSIVASFIPAQNATKRSTAEALAYG